MTATKDDITKYTKPELIKALRAAWAREARLAKKITWFEQREGELEARLAKLPPEAPAEQRGFRIIDSPRVYTQPAFPWEKK